MAGFKRGATYWNPTRQRMDPYAGETVFLNRGCHGCWVVCILNLKLWSIPFLPVNQKANPWNFAPETLKKKKLHLRDPPEAQWLFGLAQWVAVRHVAGSAAHEAHWPNPVLHVSPIFTPEPSLCLESCLLPRPLTHPFLKCFTWNSIVAKGTLGSLVEGIRFILSFYFFNLLFIWICCTLCPGAQFSTVSCCIVLRFCLTLECLVFSLFLLLLVLYPGPTT